MNRELVMKDCETFVSQDFIVFNTPLENHVTISSKLKT